MNKLLLFLWGAHSHLVPIALILAGAFLFIQFIPSYSGILTFFMVYYRLLFLYQI